MRQLERLIGAGRAAGRAARVPETVRSSAMRPGSISCACSTSGRDRDLAAWSRAWVEEAGRPTIRTDRCQIDGRSAAWRSSRATPSGRRALRTQQMRVLVGIGSAAQAFDAARSCRGERTDVDGARRPAAAAASCCRLAAAWPTAASRSTMRTRAYLLQRVSEFDDPVARGAAWVTLWDEMLERPRSAGGVPRRGAARAAAGDDRAERAARAGYLDELFWRFLPAAERIALALARGGAPFARASADRRRRRA